MGNVPYNFGRDCREGEDRKKRGKGGGSEFFAGAWRSP